MIQLVFGKPACGDAAARGEPRRGARTSLRALAWEDADGHSWLSYETPESVIERFHIPAALGANIAGLRALCEAAASAA